MDLKPTNTSCIKILIPKRKQALRSAKTFVIAGLEVVPPAPLRDNILEIYQRFLIKEHEFLPVDFQKLSSNLYILLDFLTLADKEMNKREEEV